MATCDPCRRPSVSDYATTATNGGTYTLDPRDTGDKVFTKITEFGNTTRDRVPHVDGASQPNTKDIGATPINKIQVEIVGQVRGIKDLVRDLGDRTDLSSRGEKHSLRVIANWR